MSSWTAIRSCFTPSVGGHPRWFALYLQQGLARTKWLTAVAVPLWVIQAWAIGRTLKGEYASAATYLGTKPETVINGAVLIGITGAIILLLSGRRPLNYSRAQHLVIFSSVTSIASEALLVGLAHLSFDRMLSLDLVLLIAFATAPLGLAALSMITVATLSIPFIAAWMTGLALGAREALLVVHPLSFAILGIVVNRWYLGIFKSEWLSQVRLTRRTKQLESRNIELREKNVELAEMNVALEEVRRETELKTAALIVVKEDLRKRAEQESLNKSKFLADAVHDLKQPVQALTNLLEAARHAVGRDDFGKAAELVETAQNATRVMRFSFNSFLELSRLESGLMTTDYSNFDLLDLINEIIPPLTVFATERNVALRLHKRSRRALVVRSDRQLLGRLLTNLISNGVKYSDPRKRGMVLVGVIGLPNRCRVDVVDNGIGIPRRQWDNIFKPFVQLDNPQRDREKGLGLGLSIVNAIVHLLEGHRLDMRSAEGVGTRFSIEVPRTDAPLDIGKVDEHPVADPIVNVEGLYVLYVEDDPLVRKSTEALFQAHGILFEAIGSVDRLRGLLSTLERLPDVIVTDYRLPNECTAVDVIRMVEEESKTKIPTIVVTGEAADIGDAAELEGVRILRKPVAAQVLLLEISAACQEESARSG